MVPPTREPVGEAVATKELANKVDKRAILHNDTDSKYVLQQLSTSLRKMEDAGYIGVPNKNIIQAMIASLRSRKQVTTMKWVNGHPGNTMADLLANEGANKETEDTIDLEIDPNLRVSGAALCKLTQSRAYKALRERKNKNLPQRTKTATNVMLAIQGANESFEVMPSAPAIWKSIRHKDIDRNTRYLLWMTMHEAYRIGAKWLNFAPQYHDRAYCVHCNGCLESMKHILTKCSSPGQKGRRGIPWNPPTISNILACTSPVFKSAGGNRDSGKERFYRIVVSSAGQTIWNARCERVIQRENTPFPTEEIRNRWKKKMNKRLDLDCLMTRKRFDKKALGKDLVINTWSGSIFNEQQLPRDWTKVDGVLVGIG
ncbi:hypothetical protein DFS33DRAFT_1462420 [Desarmillaria ectypa]|nr:hypothetical protein DFS33DRAFT_1462420 [Desarmillaria ectypa]